MKQHLAVEQLSILDFKQQKEIATLFGQYGNCIRNDSEGNEHFNLGLLAERINIGRMFEVLVTDLNGISFGYNDIGCDLWLYGKKRISDDNLCDTLWKAVKSMLEID